MVLKPRCEKLSIYTVIAKAVTITTFNILFKILSGDCCLMAKAMNE
jgi:hypothetical protein